MSRCFIRITSCTDARTTTRRATTRTNIDNRRAHMEVPLVSFCILLQIHSPIMSLLCSSTSLSGRKRGPRFGQLLLARVRTTTRYFPPAMTNLLWSAGSLYTHTITDGAIPLVCRPSQFTPFSRAPTAGRLLWQRTTTTIRAGVWSTGTLDYTAFRLSLLPQQCQIPVRLLSLPNFDMATTLCLCPHSDREQPPSPRAEMLVLRPSVARYKQEHTVRPRGEPVAALVSSLSSRCYGGLRCVREQRAGFSASLPASNRASPTMLCHFGMPTQTKAATHCTRSNAEAIGTHLLTPSPSLCSITRDWRSRRAWEQGGDGVGSGGATREASGAAEGKCEYMWMSFVVLRVTLLAVWLSRHFDSESTVY